MKRLENKVAFITGGGGNIGMACAERFVAEGARVVFAADVFSLAWTFSGEVYNAGSDALPQPVEPGDASAELGTNGLRIESASYSKREKSLSVSARSNLLP